MRHGSAGGILTNMNRSRPRLPQSWLLHCIRIAAVGACLSFVAGLRPALADYATGLDAFNAGAYEQAYAEWQKAALAGDKQAQHGLGLLLESGRGTKLDLAAARQWYEASAEQGFAPAMNNLAMLYAEGRGVDKDQGKAIAYWRQAAEAGNATAQFNLGVQYMRGEGVPRDPAETARLWTAAGNANYVQAQYNLGLLYAQGVGVSPDDKQAAYWIAKAAEAGLAEAQIDLAELYRAGRGVAQNADQAYHWLEKAAASGNLLARQRLTELPKPKGAAVADAAATATAQDEAPPATAGSAQDASAPESPAPESPAPESPAPESQVPESPMPAGSAPEADNVAQAHDATAGSAPAESGGHSGTAAESAVEGGAEAGHAANAVAPMTSDGETEEPASGSTAHEAAGEGTPVAEADAHQQVAEAPHAATLEVPVEGHDGAAPHRAEESHAEAAEETPAAAVVEGIEPVDGDGEIAPDGVVALLPLGEILSPKTKVFRIWLGERSTPESARNEYSNLVGKYRPMLDNLAFEIRPFVIGNSEEGHHYRIYVGDFPALKDAQAMCDRIRARYSEQFCRSVIN